MGLPLGWHKQLRHTSPFAEKESTGGVDVLHTHNRLVKRRRALVETNPPRNNQPETHPDDERGCRYQSRRPDRMDRFPDALGNS